MEAREALERLQILVYLLAAAPGLLLGAVAPGLAATLEHAIWPALAVLLYTTFTQIPLRLLPAAVADTRFLAAAILGNFVVIPVAVWLLLQFLPPDPAIRIGVLLVLLVPCTDWFISFAQFAGGDANRAIAFTPISLLLQAVLLPVYLWLLVPEEISLTFARREMLMAFGLLIVLPLVAAGLTQRWARTSQQRGEKFLQRAGWIPIPSLAAVVFVVAASQVHAVFGSLATLSRLLWVFVAFLVFAALLAKLLAAWFSLPAEQGRVLAFSFGTRNAFVVLPLALALPASFEFAAVVIVFQSLVELLGMAAFLGWVPRYLFPAAPENAQGDA